MSNEIQKSSESSIRNEVITQVKKLQEMKQIVLPSNYIAENALISAMYKLTETDKDGKTIIDKCTKESITKSLRKMVTMGLTTDKSQVAFIARGNQCVCQVQYGGNKAIAKRIGVTLIVAQCVYVGDKFDYAIVDGVLKVSNHVPSLENIDETKIIAAYAVATLADGIKITDLMSIAQIKKAWSQGSSYKEGAAYGVHANFTSEMAKKTVVNRLCKQIINESDDSYLYNESDEQEQPTAKKESPKSFEEQPQEEQPQETLVDTKSEVVIQEAHAEVVTATVVEEDAPKQRKAGRLFDNNTPKP